MKSNFIYFSIISIFIFSSCVSEFNVVNISNANCDKDVIIYSLPKTAINIKIETEEIYNQKGPFYKYAKKYFGTDDVIKSDQTEYKISKISIETAPIRDNKNIYAIIIDDKIKAGVINLTPEGFIAGINLTDFQISKFKEKQEEFEFSTHKNGKLSYADLSVWSVREAKYDTLYKEVFQDSVFVKKPIIKKKMVYKSLDKQAKELADQIFLLRDDRLSLLKGESDGGKIPEGSALKIMVDELNKLEEEYMNLFTGKTGKNSKLYNFQYIPQTNDSVYEKILFRFSKEYGILPAGDNKGTPVVLHLFTGKNTSDIKKFNEKRTKQKAMEKKSKNGIFYRIPDIASTEIRFNSKIVARKKLTISQFGTINSLPVQIFDKNLSIEFYPEYGSLKSISGNRNK